VPRHQTELLDGPEHDPADLARTLRHLDGVNRWLGGHRSLTGPLYGVLGAGSTIILDIGSGSAAVPRYLVSWAGRRGHTIRAIALDRQSQVARCATETMPENTAVCYVVGDALHLPVATDSVDVALTSLTLHHFDDDRAVQFVREMRRVARRAVLVTDLERHRINYFGARVLAATAWRRSPYAQDGPISVRRAFRPRELLEIGERAGLTRPRVERHFPFRLTLVGQS
jgi:hypothetical protein